MFFYAEKIQKKKKAEKEGYMRKGKDEEKKMFEMQGRFQNKNKTKKTGGKKLKLAQKNYFLI